MTSLDRIPDLHAAQRAFFASGKTREYNFRVKQLQQLKKLFTENEKALQQVSVQVGVSAGIFSVAKQDQVKLNYGKCSH